MAREQEQSNRYADRQHTYAAIDLGTNNCRLLVARPAAAGFRVVDAFSRIVRLGEGVDRSLRLSEEAMDRTITALQVCADKMRRRKVTRARCVATAACRRAENCDEFLHRVNKEAGLFLETISAEEEAGLAVAACQPLLEAEARFALVFDIGGGSTELIWAHHDVESGVAPIAVTSLPNGVVSIAERHGSGDFSLEQYETLVGEISHQLRAFEDTHGINDQIRRGGVQMIGTSGTVTTLSGVHLGLTRYDRQRVDGMWLSFTDASAAAEQLRAMTLQQRAAHPCIGRGRADLVVAGCAILEAIRRIWPTERLLVADRGVREGLLLSLMRGDQQRTPNTDTRGDGAQATSGIGATP